jgi:intraflagellar transport protein 80
MKYSVLCIGIPVLAVAWSPSGDSLLYSSDNCLTIKSLQPGTKAHSWQAHDGSVLATDWNPFGDLIISSGEDCCYKVWDSYGRQLFSSSPADYPITALAWSPLGDLFATGSFNLVRMCDRFGVSCIIRT